MTVAWVIFRSAIATFEPRSASTMLPGPRCRAHANVSLLLHVRVGGGPPDLAVRGARCAGTGGTADENFARWHDVHESLFERRRREVFKPEDWRFEFTFLPFYLVHRRGPFSFIKICANKKIVEERRGDYPEAGINLEYEGKTNLK